MTLIPDNLHYATKGSWEGVSAAVVELEQRGMGMGAMGRGRGAGGVQALTLADTTGRVIYDRSGQLQGQRLSASVLAAGVPLILADGRRVGTLLSVQTADVALDAQGQAFLDRVRWSLVWAGLAAAGLALALGLLVSWRLTAPLARLNRAAHGIAQGHLAQRVTSALPAATKSPAGPSWAAWASSTCASTTRSSAPSHSRPSGPSTSPTALHARGSWRRATPGCAWANTPTSSAATRCSRTPAAGGLPGA